MVTYFLSGNIDEGMKVADNPTNGQGPTINGSPHNRVPNKQEEQLRRLEDITANALMIRERLFQDLTDPRRSIEAECGYPDLTAAINAELYRQLYDREAIATRVVQVMPKESWQVTPDIFEDEDSKKATPFEQAWDDVEVGIATGRSWHQDEQGSTLWEHLLRADILSGIGHFGVILLGIDDGKNLQDPVDGVVTINHKTEYVRNSQGKVVELNLRRFKSPLQPDSGTLSTNTTDMDREEVKRLREMLESKTVVVNEATWDKSGFHTSQKIYQAAFLNSPWSEAPTTNATFSPERKRELGEEDVPEDEDMTDNSNPEGHNQYTGKGGIDFGTVRVPLHDSWRDLPAEKGYLYHATNLENASDIGEDALKPHRPGFGTDQSGWPDGSTAHRSYFTPSPSTAHIFAPEEGRPTLLRLKRTKSFKDESGTGDVYLEGKKVPPHALEMLTTDGWKRLKDRPTDNSRPCFNSPTFSQETFKGGVSNDAWGQQSTVGKTKDGRTVDSLMGTDKQYAWQGAMPPASMSGTDQQYFGVQFGGSEAFPEGGPKLRKSKKPARKLVFLRSFDESLIQVVRYEWNIRNPRFGMPVMYRITLNDPREQHSGVGLPLATVFVHWSRVIHLADNLGSSEIFGVPRQRPVLNNILALRKLYGASAEGYWKSAFTGMSLETNPQLGGDVLVDTPALKDMWEQYQNGLQRVLILMGMTAKTLAPSVVDPTSQIDVQITAICIQLGIPKRVFMGSERGELASSQDDSKFNDVLRHRQHFYLTPKVIVPFIDRLIALGILPEPEGYTVRWPDLEALGEADKATICMTRTQALGAYVAGNLETILTPLDFLTKFLDMDEEEAKSILKDAEDAQKEKQDEAASLADQHGMVPTPPEGFEHPPEPPPPQPPAAPVKLGAGQNLVHPETGKTVAKGPPAMPREQGATAKADQAKEEPQLVIHEAWFHRPENYDSIKKLHNDVGNWMMGAGANDWEVGWSAVGIHKGDPRQTEPVEWSEIDHASCPGCHGNNSKDEDGPRTKEDRDRCYDWAKGIADGWVKDRLPTVGKKTRLQANKSVTFSQETPVTNQIASFADRRDLLRNRLDDLTDQLAVHNLTTWGIDILPQPREPLRYGDRDAAAEYVENLGGETLWEDGEMVFNVDSLEPEEIQGLISFIVNCKENGKPGPCAKPKAPKAPKAPAAPKAAKVPKPPPAPKAPKPPAAPKAPKVAAVKPPAAAKAPTAPTPTPATAEGGGAAPAPATTGKGKVAEKFSGEKKDSRGYRICYTEGKKVACAKAAKEAKPAGKVAEPAPAPTPAKAAEEPKPVAPAPKAEEPKAAEKPKPGESANEHHEQAKAHGAAAVAALKAGKHDEALEHADKANASLQKAAAAPDAEDKHKVNAEEWSKGGGSLAKFKEKVAASRKEKVEKEAKEKSDKDASEKAAKEHVEKARAAKELEDKQKADKEKAKKDTKTNADLTKKAAAHEEAKAASIKAREEHNKAVTEANKAYNAFDQGRDAPNASELRQKMWDTAKVEKEAEQVRKVAKEVEQKAKQEHDIARGDALRDQVSKYEHGNNVHKAMMEHAEKIEGMKKGLESANQEVDAAVKASNKWNPTHGLEKMYKLDADVKSAQAKVKEVNESLNKAHAEARDVLLKSTGVPEGQRLKVNHSVEGLTDSQHIAKAKEGVNFVGQLLGRREGDPKIPECGSTLNDTGRDFYRPSEQKIHSSPDTDVAVHAHEFGHHLENSVPGIREAVTAFQESRCKGETPTDMGHFGMPGELGRKDDFEKAFGDEAAAHYVGKKYGSGDTEVLSMAVEKMHRDPMGFAKADPEFFKFTLGVLRGDLRGK